MPQCQQIGKDTVCFATKDELSEPSKITLAPPEQPAGLILENGEINWNCPCLGGMATGPCGVEFRSAFSCFHYSENEPKGSECLEAFQAMQDCMKKYPTLYKQSDGDEESDMAGLENISDAEMIEGENHVSERKNIEMDKYAENSKAQKAIEK